MGHVVLAPLDLTASQTSQSCHYFRALHRAPCAHFETQGVFPCARRATRCFGHSQSPVSGAAGNSQSLAHQNPHRPVSQKIPPGFRVDGHASSQVGCIWAYSRLRGSHLSAYSQPAAT
jgi:hypothetical protein